MGIRPPEAVTRSEVSLGRWEITDCHGQFENWPRNDVRVVSLTLRMTQGFPWEILRLRSG